MPRTLWARRNGLSHAIKCEASHALLEQKGQTLEPLPYKRPVVGNEFRLHRSQHETRTGRRRRRCVSRSWKMVCLVGSTTLLDRMRLEGAFTLLDEEAGQREEKGRERSHTLPRLALSVAAIYYPMWSSRTHIPVPPLWNGSQCLPTLWPMILKWHFLP